MKKIIVALLLLASSLRSENVFEDFSDITTFKTNKAAQARIAIASVPGYLGQGLNVDYDLTADHFVEFYRAADLDLRTVDEVSWWMQGDANGSIIEIKFVDTDGSTFGTKYPITGVTAETWKKFTLARRDLHYMWGGDQNLDRIKDFYIAVSRGLARAGSFIIDEFGVTQRAVGQPSCEININQTGYHPGDNKFMVIRLLGLAENIPVTGDFQVSNTVTKKIIYHGALRPVRFSDWEGTYLKGIFNELRTPGEYQATINLKTGDSSMTRTSYPFTIAARVLSEKTLALELEYMRYQRCGVRCHKHDPVMGGYHDTLFDISKRMWSLPALIYGMAQYAANGQYHPDNNGDGRPDDHEELLWGMDFLANIPEPDGTVSWGGIEADFEKYMTYEQFIVRIGTLRPESDTIPRIKYKDKNLAATSYNLIALLAGNQTVKKYDAALAAKAESVALAAWQWVDNQPLNEARDYGFYLWAATELYNYSGDKKYLARVPEVLPKLLALQALDFRVFENYACGDFYTSGKQRDFINQYKFVSFNIAINLALFNLVKQLPKTDPLWLDVYYANRVFGENYLKGMAEKTPYEQMAVGLEADAAAVVSANQNQWSSGANEGSVLNLMLYPENNTAVLEFDLTKGNWVQASRKLNAAAKGLQKIRFTYRYQGAANNLEVKITDTDNTTFGFRKQLAASDDWLTQEIDISEIKYWWGANKQLDANKLNEFWLAIAKSGGGTGSLWIKDITVSSQDGNVTELPTVKAGGMKFRINYFAGVEAKAAAAENHGLNCDHLGRALVALKWGQYIGDLELEEYADNQVNWVLGVNPLDYGMLIGAGSKNPIIMAAYYDKPSVPGIIPNGIVGSGEHDEPEWRGDGPSSGEDWLPHNAAYFALLAEIENPAVLTGMILQDGKPALGAKLEVMDKKQLIAAVKTDAAGAFTVPQLPGQKTYTLVISKGGKKTRKRVTLLTGSRKEITIDLHRDANITIKRPEVVKEGIPAVFTVHVPKRAMGRTYSIQVKGGRLDAPATGTITALNLQIPVIPEHHTPLLIRFTLDGQRSAGSDASPLVPGAGPVSAECYISNY